MRRFSTPLPLVPALAAALALWCCDGPRPEPTAAFPAQASPLYAELLAKPPDILAAMALDREPLIVIEPSGYHRVSTRLTASLDESPGWLGVTPGFRQATGLTGKNVIIGIVDTGIDWTHPDFLGEDGTTRILYILDLMLPAQYPDPHPEAPHGIYRIYGKSEIDAALESLALGLEPDPPVETTDRVGHGTAMASIAAGRDPSGLRSGMAPDAWIVVVKALRSEGVRFEDIDVSLGVEFLFSVCDLYGLPCVVNLSLGGQMGGHDGSSPVERTIADLIAEKPQGRVVAAAAGNHGRAPIHAALDLEPGQSAEVELRVPANEPPEPGGVSRVVLDAWIRPPHPATGVGAALTVVTPSGRSLSAASGELGQEVLGDTWVALSNAPSGPDPYNGQQEALVTLTGHTHLGGAVTPGAYRIVFSGQGAADLYLAQVDMRTGILGTTYLAGEHVTASGVVDMPATSRDVLAAGALTTRTSWTSADGYLVDFSGATDPGEIAAFSSAGPGRDGAIKPDFIAPGEWIAAALSASTDASNADAILHGFTPANVVTSDGGHVFSRGTSLASPHLAGGAALLLQEDPDLTADEVRAALLIASLKRDAWPDAAALEAQGFGLPDLDAAAGFAAGLQGGAVDAGASVILAAAGLYAPAFSPPVEILVIPLDETMMPASGVESVTVVPTHCAMEGEAERVEPGLFVQSWSCGEADAPPPGRDAQARAAGHRALGRVLGRDSGNVIGRFLTAGPGRLILNVTIR
jgi:subtilisin family serine protease